MARGGSQTSFPYTLIEHAIGFIEYTTGFDTAMKEPCDVWQYYLLDTLGNFHQEIRERDQTTVMLCGPDQQARLTHFLMKGTPIPFAQYNQQEN